MRTRIKVCGFTDPENAAAAAYHGVDAIGLVFYPPSPRNISLEQGRKVVAALPAFVTTVGLFVDESQAVIERVLSQVSIDLIQFHGDESPAFCRVVGRPYIKAVRMRPETDLMQLADDFFDASALLLDSYHPDLKGGTGHHFDWKLIPENYPLPIILAGGISVENAQQAIKQARPYALDVSSGVERQKGMKDINKIVELITEVELGDRRK
ncbi:MAG TPA: phosphoribosylanthranilate isomerase [Methylococcaceae bacterium]|jgi:phosphoribosylanthranilate isomerase|nr:phosphoribosylanthranilate isomerase [Methylococcaceae bacterium]HIN68073.1 phosphoribosylanthranilate isomerase [Methylococcales bacterium]HIA45290.1 phosphoribosylanthranilate isomerase [Methylococcaceae bacterium]HIB63362.1 phosphoribosylanthranilate isomerase [Methylococcaceae bacterium]HIO13489.1 phosphoribosylanthranilate isomerase [Methylococcales bacterium]